MAAEAATIKVLQVQDIALVEPQLEVAIKAQQILVTAMGEARGSVVSVQAEAATIKVPQVLDIVLGAHQQEVATKAQKILVTAMVEALGSVVTVVVAATKAPPAIIKAPQVLDIALVEHQL